MKHNKSETTSCNISSQHIKAEENLNVEDYGCNLRPNEKKKQVHYHHFPYFPIYFWLVFVVPSLDFRADLLHFLYTNCYDNIVMKIYFHWLLMMGFFLFSFLFWAKYYWGKGRKTRGNLSLSKFFSFVCY